MYATTGVVQCYAASFVAFSGRAIRSDLQCSDQSKETCGGEASPDFDDVLAELELAARLADDAERSGEGWP